jgi:hypothetical protein
MSADLMHQTQHQDEPIALECPASPVTKKKKKQKKKIVTTTTTSTPPSPKTADDESLFNFTPTFVYPEFSRIKKLEEFLPDPEMILPPNYTPIHDHNISFEQGVAAAAVGHLQAIMAVAPAIVPAGSLAEENRPYNLQKTAAAEDATSVPMETTLEASEWPDGLPGISEQLKGSGEEVLRAIDYLIEAGEINCSQYEQLCIIADCMKRVAEDVIPNSVPRCPLTETTKEYCTEMLLRLGSKKYETCFRRIFPLQSATQGKLSIGKFAIDPHTQINHRAIADASRCMQGLMKKENSLPPKELEQIRKEKGPASRLRDVILLVDETRVSANIYLYFCVLRVLLLLMY